MLKRILMALSCALVFIPAQADAPEAPALARAIDSHYNNLKTLKADFVQIYQGPGISRAESGVLWLKKPGKMRWEYHQPVEKLFVTDSQTAYFYVPGERQARKTAVKNLDDLRSPIRYLLGKTKLEKELEALSLAPDIKPLHAGDFVLRGIPKALKDRVSEVLLEVNPQHQLVRILVHELDGTTTDFQFSQLAENVAAADSLFRFQPPAGVETIQDDRMAQ
jgi:outer membrane lipoprotein carrier protein